MSGYKKAVDLSSSVARTIYYQALRPKSRNYFYDIWAEHNPNSMMATVVRDTVRRKGPGKRLFEFGAGPGRESRWVLDFIAESDLDIDSFTMYDFEEVIEFSKLYMDNCEFDVYSDRDKCIQGEDENRKAHKVGRVNYCRSQLFDKLRFVPVSDNLDVSQYDIFIIGSIESKPVVDFITSNFERMKKGSTIVCMTASNFDFFKNLERTFSYTEIYDRNPEYKGAHKYRTMSTKNYIKRESLSECDDWAAIILDK